MRGVRTKAGNRPNILCCFVLPKEQPFQGFSRYLPAQELPFAIDLEPALAVIVQGQGELELKDSHRSP